MTVKDLINKLNAIEDKSIDVRLYNKREDIDCSWPIGEDIIDCVIGVVDNDGSVEILSEDRKLKRKEQKTVFLKTG